MNNLEILTCTVNDLNKKLEDGENCQIIDVREEHEYERVRIKNSKLLPLSLFEKDYVNVDKSKPAYMLCAIGKRATMAANYLMANGYKDVIVIDGGIKDWIDSGLEVEVGA